MMSRTQITLQPEVQRRARRRASDLGISLAEYVRRLAERDLGSAAGAADPTLVFDLGTSGGFRHPILMLTARDAVDDRVAGLDSGADDYLTKPFDFKELLARIRALLRRPREIRPEVMRAGDLILNTGNHTATRRGRAISLTAKEYALLEFLMQRPNRIVNREQIAQH